MDGLGRQQLTVSTTAVGLTVPETANFALIRVATANVRFDDGANPTATAGFPLNVDDVFEYDGELGSIKFIRKDAADATLDIQYYRKG